MAGKPRQLPEERFYRELGRNIRTARGAAGKSQTDVAEHMDRTFQQVQKYENGKDRIPLYALVSLADYLEVPLSQFLAPSDSDSEFQSLAEKFSARELHAFMKAWGSIKDRSARVALVNLARCMANIKR
jgi:transcriptional regulator with XRE-family HTH domain